MQAIRTVYKGPTDTKGSRIIATSGNGRTVMPYNHALDSAGNHAAAAQEHVDARFSARALVTARLYVAASGDLSDGSYAHVLALLDASS